MAKTTQYSAVNLVAEAGVDPEKWSTVPSPEIVEQTVKAVRERGIQVITVENGDEALATLKQLIPRSSEVMNGSSTTLNEIGYDELVKEGTMGWKDLHGGITAENDSAKRAALRRKSVTAEYFLSSANAIAQSGEIVGCDLTGSRVGAWPFAAGHLILVAGANKIVPTLKDALDRVWEYVYRLENVRAKRATGAPSAVGKCVIIAKETIPGRITLVLVREALGY